MVFSDSLIPWKSTIKILKVGKYISAMDLIGSLNAKQNN